MNRSNLFDFTKAMLELENAGYRPINPSQKNSFQRLGLAFVRQLAVDVGMTPGSYRVSYNKGGPAVSGDVTLHHKNVYVQFNADQICKWILYRSCNGMKDYTGGINRQEYWRNLTDEDGYMAFVEKLQDIIRKAQ